MSDARSPAGEVHDAESVRTLGECARVLFSRRGPRVIAGIAAATWAARLAAGGFGPLDAVAAGAALAVWPVQEWVAHKYLLHLEPRTVLGVRVDPYFARKHRDHHAAPRDVDGTLLPLRVILGAAPFTGAAWALLFGGHRAALTAMATYSTMALVYEWTHLLVHTGYLPSSAFAKRVRQNHRLHHWRNEGYWFAFTLPLVDRAMGTDPDPASVPRSPTATDLHGLRAAEAAQQAR